MFGEAVKVIPLSDDRVSFEYRDDAMLKYLASMSGLDGALLDNLSASEYLKLRGARRTSFSELRRAPFSTIGRLMAVMVMDYHMSPSEVDAMTRVICFGGRIAFRF